MLPAFHAAGMEKIHRAEADQLSQEMGHLRTAHGVGTAADRDAGGRWVRICGGFDGAHGHGGVGGCYGGPEAGWQPFR